MPIISINKETCIQCGKCVRICPAQIFSQSAQNEIYTQNEISCIACGHCVGVCPTKSVNHSGFPPEKVHPIDKNLLPTPEQVMLLCKTRRSNRAFSSRPIPEDKLDLILEAAHRAPTASNLQEVKFTLVTNPYKLQEVVRLTIETFERMTRKLKNPFLRPFLKLIMPQAYVYLPYLLRLQEEYDKGNDPILRNATALLLFHTPKESNYGCENANLAYQNGSLMAESLGVTQFYTGFLINAIRKDKKRKIANSLCITDKIYAGMALAMPNFGFENYIDKKEMKVRRI